MTLSPEQIISTSLLKKPPSGITIWNVSFPGAQSTCPLSGNERGNVLPPLSFSTAYIVIGSNEGSTDIVSLNVEVEFWAIPGTSTVPINVASGGLSNGFPI